MIQRNIAMCRIKAPSGSEVTQIKSSGCAFWSPAVLLMRAENKRKSINGPHADYFTSARFHSDMIVLLILSERT